jgi:hypothetical protein
MDKDSVIRYLFNRRHTALCLRVGLFIAITQVPLLSGCSQLSKIFLLKKTMVDVDVRASTDASGATSGTIEHNAVVRQRLNSQDGIVASFQPASLNQNILVKISKANSIAIPELAQALNLGAFKDSGQAVQITSTPQVDLLKPMRVTLSAPADLNLQTQWVVIFETLHSHDNNQYFSGVIPNNQLLSPALPLT